MIDQLIAHLSRRPFAKILKELPERQQKCERALKLMCIVDYQMEEYNFYRDLRQLENRPTLIYQLLKFDYCLFKYYHYRPLEKTQNRLLKCKYCSVVADYNCILTHMAIRHNAHVGLKMCAYCGTSELSRHPQEFNGRQTFEECYEKYSEKYGIKNRSTFETYMIEKFYKLMREIGNKIGVIVSRNQFYGGTAQREIEEMKRLHGHDMPQLSVGFPVNCKKIDDTKFFALFDMIAKKIGIISFECYFCHLKCDSRSDLSSHMEIVHVEKEKKEHRGFNASSGLQAKKRAAASKQAVASKVIKIMKPVIDNMKTEKAQWGDDDDVILIVRLNAPPVIDDISTEASTEKETNEKENDDEVMTVDELMTVDKFSTPQAGPSYVKKKPEESNRSKRPRPPPGSYCFPLDKETAKALSARNMKRKPDDKCDGTKPGRKRSKRSK